MRSVLNITVLRSCHLWVIVVVLAAATTIAARMVTSARERRLSMLSGIHAISDVRQAAVRARLEDYFKDVSKDLRLISSHDDVVAWRSQARQFIDNVFRANHQYHRMTEVYLIERSFDGHRRPFMTFECEESHGKEGHAAKNKPHAPESEAEEYAVQMKHMARFAADPALQIQLSSPLHLCAELEGLVMSVPVRHDGELVGIVAGMIPLETVRHILEEPKCHEMVALRERGGRLIVCEDMPPALKSELQHRSVTLVRGPSGDRPTVGDFPRYSVGTTSVAVGDDAGWDLLYLHDDTRHLAEMDGSQGTEWIGAILVLAMGALIAVLFRMITSLRTARVESERDREALKQTNQKLENIAEGIPDSILLIAPDYRILWANRAAIQEHGKSLDHLVGQPCYKVTHGRDTPCEAPDDPCPLLINGAGDSKQPLLHLHRHTTGKCCHVEVSAHPVHDNQGRVTQYVHLSRDVTAQVELEQKLRHLASHDKLTGLPNRMLFCDRLQQAVLRSRRHKEYHFAVLYLDFDRFKTVNDSLGHDMGDLLLKEIAARLGTAVRGGDSISHDVPEHVAARLGGDEFVVFLDAIARPSDATVVADRLLKLFSQPYRLGKSEIYSTASIGIVTSDGAANSADEVLRDADTAMYQAKLAGKARHVVFDISMRDHARHRLVLENDLRKAVDAGELELMYQPIVSLRTGDIDGFEALVRWQHPRLGMIMPGEFVPIAEETGQIVAIGEWVLRHACQDMARWRSVMGERAPQNISVNLSRNQLLLPDLPGTVAAILTETGLPPKCLHLEITESAIMRDTQSASQILRAIGAIGVRLDMDDFGTGYSSLACLHQFPMDVLKIDRSFVANLAHGRDFAALIQAVTQLARNLGISVIAEGIETREQMLLLQALDCEFGQGYLFAKPMPSNEVEQFQLKTATLPGVTAA